VLELRVPPPLLPPEACLFLDFDGTLVELADRPDAVKADDRVRRIVERAQSYLHGRVAIITGREAGFVRAQMPLPGLAIAGSHGQELHFGDGRTRVPPAPISLNDLGDWLEAESRQHAGVLVERKLLGVALHYRMAPEAENWAHSVAGELAQQHGLDLQPGKMMIELRTSGSDKGGAIREFLSEPEFSGRMPVFLGDDLTDEPAFVAAAAAGGWGVLVGTARPSAARYGLPDVPALLDWLERAVPA